MICRRLVVPEVYDLMGRVEDVLVSAQSVPVRQACASALMQFLLDYPLGTKRLAHHLHHLLANLAYEHEDGRLAALDMLQVRSHILRRSLWRFEIDWKQTLTNATQKL